MTRLLRVELAQDSTEVLVSGALTGADWITAAGILVGSLVLATIVSRLLRRVLAHGIGPGFASIMMARLTGYAVFLVGLFYALSSLGVRVGPLLGALGLGGLVVALALQGLVENFVGSIILQARRPFTIGDTVEIDGSVGIVADIDSRTTLLHSLSGTHIRIPNSTVVSSTTVNLTREGVRRSTLDVGVAYDTDLERAFAVLEASFSRVSRVVETPPPLVTVAGFGESSIGFSLLYWHNSDVPSELAARTDLTIAVHQSLTAAGITIAFPQVVVWSGVDGGAPYDGPPGPVTTSHPGQISPDPPVKQRIGPQLRRTGRRKTAD